MGQNAEDENQSLAVKFAVLQNDIKYLTNEVEKISVKLGSSYVTREEFDPIKRAVYGVIGLVATGLIGAALAVVLK